MEFSFEKIKEMVTQAWQAAFREEPRIEDCDGGVSVNQYLITSEQADVESVSILGRETKTVDGWALSEYVDVPGTYWDPPDVDEIPLGVAKPSIYSIVTDMIQHEAKHRADCALESFSMHEHYLEINEEGQR